MTRAIEGIEQPVYHFGAVVGTRRVYNDRLIMFLWQPPRRKVCRKLRPQRRRNDPHPARQLKLEWRAQWEAERRASSENSEAIVLSINRKLELMRRRTLAMMSPRTRELHGRLRGGQGRRPRPAAGARFFGWGRGWGSGGCGMSLRSCQTS